MTYLNKARMGWLVLVSIIFTLLTACSLFSKAIPNRESSAGTVGMLAVHYIDVGQGDSTLIVFPHGYTMLIDGGNKQHGQTVIDYLHKQHISRVDAVVATHPDADHIGGLAAVIDAFDVQAVYMPRKNHTTKTYEHLLDTIAHKGLKIKEAKAGVYVPTEDGIETECIGPTQTYTENNNSSAVVRITDGSKAFLFMGDAEKIAEADMIRAGEPLQADVLKLGHHGSHSSTSEAFLDAVHPKYAIVSAGKNNDYGHPHQEVLALLKKHRIQLYRTDQMGDIVIRTDGHKLYVP